MADLSVIIPVHTNDYFVECLQSVASQTEKGFSTIVVFDNCTDNSPEILERFRNQINDISVFYTNGGKPSIARNKGIKESAANYVTFLDSDDVLKPGAVATIKADIKALPNRLQYCYGVESDEGIRRIGFEQNVFVFGKAYNRRFLIDNNLLFNENVEFEEDMLFNVALHEKIIRSNLNNWLNINPVDIVMHRENAKSMTHTRPERVYFDSWILARLFCQNCDVEEYTEMANKYFSLNAFHVCKLAVLGTIKAAKFFELVKESKILRYDIPKPKPNYYDKFRMYREIGRQRGATYEQRFENGDLKAERLYKKYFEPIIGLKYFD